jgi:hypothetical protein
VRESHEKRVAKILETFITPQVTEARLAKEAANTALAATGMSAVRLGAYAYGAVTELFQEAERAAARGEAEAPSALSAIRDGFAAWWSKAVFAGYIPSERKKYNFIEAMGTLGRPIGLAAMATGGAEMIDDALNRYGAEPLPEMEAAAPQAPENTSGLEMYRGPVPIGAEVDAGDRLVVAPLGRVIAQNPEAYGLQTEDEDVLAVQAKRLAIEMAKDEGLLKLGLTDKAAHELFLIPEKTGDSDWTIVGVDKDWHRLTVDDMKERGYIAAQAKSKK